MRALSIVLGILLLASLAGNTVLGTLVLDYNRQIIELQNTVAQKQTRINEIVTQYNEATEQIKSANNLITTQQNDIARLLAAEETYKRDLNNYRDRLSKADYFVSRAKCPVMVDELKAFAANSNEDVRSAIIKVHDATYTNKSISSQWITMWSGSKDAVLLITTKQNTSTRFIVTWTYDGDAIQTIYDVNSGCITYTGDR
jgi:vacuolar-type H+-ATPase subunit I/STV1